MHLLFKHYTEKKYLINANNNINTNDIFLFSHILFIQIINFLNNL